MSFSWGMWSSMLNCVILGAFLFALPVAWPRSSSDISARSARYSCLSNWIWTCIWKLAHYEPHKITWNLHTSMGTSSTTYAKTPMAIKMTYWNAMNIHIELAKLVSKIFIVKQSIPALVMTEATAVICKIDNHVPISCAPTGMVRLNLILNHSTLQHCNSICSPHHVH